MDSKLIITAAALAALAFGFAQPAQAGDRLGLLSTVSSAQSSTNETGMGHVDRPEVRIDKPQPKGGKKGGGSPQ